MPYNDQKIRNTTSSTTELCICWWHTKPLTVSEALRAEKKLPGESSHRHNKTAARRIDEFPSLRIRRTSVSVRDDIPGRIKDSGAGKIKGVYGTGHPSCFRWIQCSGKFKGMRFELTGSYMVSRRGTRATLVMLTIFWFWIRLELSFRLTICVPRTVSLRIRRQQPNLER